MKTYAKKKNTSLFLLCQMSYLVSFSSFIHSDYSEPKYQENGPPSSRQRCSWKIQVVSQSWNLF